MPEKKALHTIDVSGHTVIVKKSARRKTMAIKVNNDGVFLHIPDILPLDIATAFVSKKIAWIEQKLQFTQQQENQPKFREGDSLLLFGEQYKINRQQQEKSEVPVINLRDKIVLIPDDIADLTDEDRQASFHQWYQQQARDYLIERSETLSQHCNLQASSFQVKNYKARWGSCTHNGHIRYNWKVIQAPKAVIDYLIIHELCHLREHNHSPAFWSLVAKYCPDYKQQRQWLKTFGHIINI